MIYDQVEQCYLTTEQIFADAYANLLSAKGVTAPVRAFTLIKRQDAETSTRFDAEKVNIPSLGIYCRKAATQAKDQEKRDTLSEMTWDCYAEGLDPALLAKQVELAGEALLQVLDALPESGLGVFGAGELESSVRFVLSNGFEEAQGITWWHRCVMTAPIHDRDEPL